MGVHFFSFFFTFGTLFVPCGSVQGLTFDLIYLSRGYMGVMLSIQPKARLSLEAVSAAAVQRNEHRIASLGTGDPHVGCEGIC